MNHKFALKAIAFAAIMAVAQASQAINITAKSTTDYFNLDSSIFGQMGYTVEPWSVVNGSSSVLAFCIDPLTWGIPSVTNYSANSYAPSDLVRNLYESSYSNVFVAGVYNSDKAASFQLALWSLTNLPGSVVLAETGGAFDNNDAISKDANTWVQAAKDYSYGGVSHYSYTEYKSLDHSSQTVLAVAAVPEPETWAMMLLGAGMVGFMGRRKSKKSEQFAA